MPELSVTDNDISLAFYRKYLGFSVHYERPEERFAFIERGSVAIMLDEIGTGRDWMIAPLANPFGRGIILQIPDDDICRCSKCSQQPAPLCSSHSRRGRTAG